MKGGLYFVYTSLLTVSVLSSCALFILVVSEASLPSVSAGDSSGLSNVTDSTKVAEADDPSARESPPKPPNDGSLEKKPQLFAESELTFAEALSHNSVIANGLPDTGQPPILISLADSVKLEIQDASENLSMLGNNSNQYNDTRSLVTNETARGDQLEKDTTSEGKKTYKDVPETLIVQARPMAEVKQEEEAFMATSQAPPKVEEIEVENVTVTENIPSKDETPHEDIPSFSEWAQKQLAEAEKQETVLNHSSQPSHITTNNNNKNSKLRSKNYASPACGAKVVAVNPEAASASSILSPNRDEYMLNTCNSRVWFTIELCEPIQAQKIELANFELFSSSPKDFVVYFSDRFPTRDWTSVGQFMAKNDKEVQSFDLYPHLFGKFIKVEVMSHYGSEHYCPISLFKVYGTSEFEVLEKENSQHPDAHIEEEDDEILGDLPDVPITDTEVSKNLFGSARDAVMSIMKKAAQVLVKSETPKNDTVQHGDNKTMDVYKRCCTPSHIIVCDNCSHAMFNEVHDLISCSSHKLTNLINIAFVHETLRNTEICQPYGLDFRNKRTISFRNERAVYMSAVFSENYIAALCNFMAIIDKKVVLNTSYETEMNVTTNLTLDKVSNTVVDESNLHDIIQIPFKDPARTEDDSGALQIDTKVPIAPDLTQSLVKNDTENERIPQKVPETPKDNTPGLEPSSKAKVDEEEKNQSIYSEVTPKENATGENGTATAKAEELESANVPQSDIITNVNTETAINTKLDPVATDNTQNTNAASDKDKTQNIIAQPPLITDDIPDQLAIETENFLSELDQLISDPTVQTTASPSITNNQGPPQKESVFLRLSNRVKTLERNMSLSGQYLEELSRRYKKQVEEMQKSFEKTILQINEERKKTEDRDQHNSEQLGNLQNQLARMNEAMQVLLDERDSWFGNITFFKFLIFQSIIVAIALYYINKKPIAEPTVTFDRKTSRSRKKEERKLRRKSVEGVSGHETPAGKKRRPSEEAMHIARQSTEYLNQDDEGEWQVARKNRRRKASIMNNTPPNFDQPAWSRQDSLVLQENIIPLDEEEFIAPVSEPKDFSEIVPVAPHKEFPKTNGSILNNLKSKAVKSRRLSSPAFLRTALSRQSSRKSPPSPVVLRINTSGDIDGQAPSGSPTSSVRSESVILPGRGNGSCVSETGSVKTSKRRSLKNIFRKVF